jgi:nicotinate-nucleotide adenylyltransferase
VPRAVVFGGSFNPIHFGHLLLADEVVEILGLDRVIFVPVAEPPHKPPTDMAPAADRHAMVALAIAGHPRFTVSDVELRRPGSSYTVDTLAALHTSSADELLLLMGSDTFLDLLSWRDPARVASLARLVVVPRTGAAFDPESEQAQKVLREIGATRFVDASAGGGEPSGTVIVAHARSLPISASELRERVRRGRSLAYRLPESVIAYIEAHGLYRAAA